MTWLLENKVHWLLELFTQPMLPIYEGMSDAFVKVKREKLQRAETLFLSIGKYY